MDELKLKLFVWDEDVPDAVTIYILAEDLAQALVVGREALAPHEFAKLCRTPKVIKDACAFAVWKTQ